MRIRGCVMLLFSLLLLAHSGCMKWDYGREVEEIEVSGQGLFITNEGNFQYGNATLSYYDPTTKQVQNEVFLRANGMKLGDVAQSMTIYDGKGWVVVNNSHVIFAIDLATFKEVGRIENLTSPRYIHFLSPEKAYVTQLWDNRIFIVNPKKFSVEGYIAVPNMEMESGSTEQVVQHGRYAYVNGYEAPSLYCIDAEKFEVEKQFKYKLGDHPSEVQLNGAGDTLYWINRDIWRMDVASSRLPVRPFIRNSGTIFFSLTVSPATGEVYVADAVDYMQPGLVYRYSPNGALEDRFNVGINPGAFCWK